MSVKITKRTVEAATPAAADTFLWDTEIGGFGIRITPRGVRSYVLQYRLRGRPARRTTIGIHGSPWTPDAARQEALRLLVQVRQGIDPVAERIKAAQLASDLGFEAYVARFTENYLKTEWPDTWREAQRQLERYIVPKFRARPLNAIERHEITAIFDGMRSTPAAARNTHAALRKLFRWAVNRGDLVQSPIADMTAPPAPKARKRILSPDELRALWLASYTLSDSPGDPFGPWLRLLILTLQRRNEVSELSWQELSEAEALWNLPGARAKNGCDHQVPLSPLAMAELIALGWQRTGLLFTTTGKTAISGFSRKKAQLDRKMLPILQRMADERADAAGEDRAPVVVPQWQFHDIRRSGVTRLQALGVAIETAEKVINHISGETGGIRGTYNLHKYQSEKRRALDSWAVYLAELISGDEPSPNVIALAGRRA